MRNNRFLLALAGLLLLASVPVLGQTEITVDSVVGSWGSGHPDTVLTGTPIIFRLRYHNGTANNLNISNGYEIYSPDGASWLSGPKGDTLGVIPRSSWDLQFQMNVFDTLGDKDADTVGIIAAKISATGLAAGFNDVPYAVVTGGFANSDHGTHICIDSAWFRPGGTWKWAASGGINYFPTWGGPYCYTIVDTTQITDVTDRGGELPTTFALDQNYPNPFNPTTIINFDIPRNSKVNLTIYNVLGQAVKTLVDKELTAGKYQADWDATSDAGNKVASGVYFYKIEAGDFVQTKKMMLLR